MICAGYPFLANIPKYSCFKSLKDGGTAWSGEVMSNCLYQLPDTQHVHQLDKLSLYPIRSLSRMQERQEVCVCVFKWTQECGRSRNRNSVSARVSLTQIHFVSRALPLIHHPENRDNRFFQLSYLVVGGAGANLINGFLLANTIAIPVYLQAGRQARDRVLVHVPRLDTEDKSFNFK